MDKSSGTLQVLHQEEADSAGTSTVNLRPLEYSDMEASKPVSDDTVKLRALGYDAALGRPLGFWSSTALTFCHTSFLVEAIMAASMYSYYGPMLFLVGYPCLFVLHLILLGSFAELASAFPVAGALATWSWRCARAGVRNERQWGWLVSGIVLAAHLGKAIAYLYNAANSLTDLYVMRWAWEKVVPDWCRPTFHVLLVSITALVMFTRVGRHSVFWIFCGIVNLGIFIAVVVFIGKAGNANGGVGGFRKPPDLGFPARDTWTHSFSYMIFLGLPLKAIAVDAPAHMAEETRNPTRTVPRVMYAATTLTFISTYVIVAGFIFLVVPAAPRFQPGMPLAKLNFILQFDRDGLPAMQSVVVIASCFQLVATTVVTSRYIFGLARDCAIPFSNFLVKTDKKGEPWAADVTIIFVLYASVAGWGMGFGTYFNMIQSFWFWFPSYAYIFPLALYLLSDLDLQFMDRTQFSLRSWSKPLAAVSCSWLLLTLIQGSFPIPTWSIFGQWNFFKEDQLSSLPFIMAAMVLVMCISWFLYGNRNYIGPVRALTKWSAGVEINPMDFATAKGRASAIRSYIQSQTSKKTRSSGSRSATKESAGLRSWRFFGRRKGSGGVSTVDRIFNTNKSAPIAGTPSSGALTHRRRSSAPALGESALLPGGETTNDAALAESGLFPHSRPGNGKTYLHTNNMAPALVESNVFPEQSQIDPTPPHPRKITVIREDEELDSVPMRSLPSPRRPGYRRAWSDNRAQEESQLEPRYGGSTWVMSHLRAQEESQLEPEYGGATWGGRAQEESQLEPEYGGTTWQPGSRLPAPQLEPESEWSVAQAESRLRAQRLRVQEESRLEAEYGESSWDTARSHLDSPDSTFQAAQLESQLEATSTFMTAEESMIDPSGVDYDYVYTPRVSRQEKEIRRSSRRW